jgi:hypothetical protein
MTIDDVLARLVRCRKTGANRWIACCPSHDDKRPSLSISQTDDGRILLHDFGGCEPGDVVAALGLTFGDRFPRPLGEFRPCKSSIPASDLLVVFDHELLVVILILNDVVDRGAVNESQLQRLIKASSRIGHARDMVNPARVSHVA